MEEKKIPLTIRLPESKVNLIKEMASFFKVSPSKLASTMLEAGFVIMDDMKARETKEGQRNG